MRRAPVIILFFVLFLGLLNSCIQQFSQQIQPEAFLAPDTLLVVQQKNLEKRIAEFRASSLGGILETIDYEGIAEAVGRKKAEIETLKTIRHYVEQALSDPLTNILIGKEVTVALSPFKYHKTSSYEQQLVNNFIVIARPKFSSKISDIAIKIGFESDQVTETIYGGYLINRLIVNDTYLFAVRVKDLILASFDESLLRRCLDRFDSGRANLLSSADYQQVRSHYMKASLFCFLNLATLPQFLLGPNGYFASHEINETLFEPDILKGYTRGFLGVWQKKDKIHDKAIVSFDSENIPEELAGYKRRKPEIPHSYTRVGPDTIWYYWTNSFKSEPFVELFKRKTEPHTPSDDSGFLKQLSDITGLTREEMVDLVDGDFTMAMKAIDEDELVPIPFVMWAFKSRKPELLRASVEKVIEHYAIPVHRQNINNVEVISWGGGMGIGNILPSVAFVDNYMIVASNHEQIKDFIQLGKGRGGLAANRLFKSVNATLIQKNNSITFVHFAEMTRVLKELVSWGGTILAIQDREGARKSKILIDRLINPLLDGLSIYSVIASRKYIENHNIILESTTIVNDGNKKTRSTR